MCAELAMEITALNFPGSGTGAAAAGAGAGAAVGWPVSRLMGGGGGGGGGGGAGLRDGEARRGGEPQAWRVPASKLTTARLMQWWWMRRGGAALSCSMLPSAVRAAKVQKSPVLKEPVVPKETVIPFSRMIAAPEGVMGISPVLPAAPWSVMS